MQAIILAAGMGKRLKDLTKDRTKCMVEVNGVTLIERMLLQLDKLGLSRIIVVVGYKAEKLVEYVSSLKINTPIEYVNNDIYYKTNNIYSLYLARSYLLEEDTILLESDLIFEDGVLKKLIDDPYPSLALVAKYESWMDGTVVTIDEENNIKSFLTKKDFKFEDIKDYYKTVNIYKFSKKFSNTHYVPFLEAYSKALGNNEYYEQVLKVISLLDRPEIKAAILDDETWYEIDDVQDLDIAESIFTNSIEDKLTKFQRRYGGYWRYPRLLDFCYLVNPFYPTPRLLDEIKANFERLVCEYPSGLEVNSLLAAKYFGLTKDQIVVGNGAAELIKSLMSTVNGKVGTILPTFDEYLNRSNIEEIVSFYPNNRDLAYSANDLIDFYNDKDIDILVLINPDNPSGNYIVREDVLRIADWAEKKGIILVVDESFVDFVETDHGTLLERNILNNYPGLIVIKSISKSFGVPGLRLGILASKDSNLINSIKKDVAIWNINSFAEFYLQIFEKYKCEYKKALEKFKKVRRDFISQLKNIQGLRVLPTQANFITCEVLGNTSKELAALLLDKHDILIKDLSTKKGIPRQYIRVAIRRPEENDRLIDALTEIFAQ